MSSQTSKKQETTAVTPIKELRGHSDRVQGVVHLPEGQQIMTCSWDGSLRLWDLESGTQIGEDWKDCQENGGVNSITLSPNGKTLVTGGLDGKVKLWDVETGKVIQRWTGHTQGVTSVCWSAGGDRILSGSWDGWARIWNATTGETILEINTGHASIWAVKYSPDDTQIATGGYNQSVAKIWDAKTGELIKTLEHDRIVLSLAWTSDGKKLITTSRGSIRIFDTATWEQIATLEGHTSWVNAITLSRNNRLLASCASNDKTARIWNLDTNLPVGPPLHHKDWVYSAVFSANGRVLVTGCSKGNMYIWDVHAILKQAGLEDLLPTGDASQGERTPCSSLSDKSFLQVRDMFQAFSLIRTATFQADATRCHDGFGGIGELSPRFFVSMGANNDSFPTGGFHPLSSASALLARLASVLHRFRPDNADANEPSQPLTLSGLHPHVLFARLSSVIHRPPAENDVPNELQQPSTPSRLDLHAIVARLTSIVPRSQLNTEETESHTVTPSRPDAVTSLLSSPFSSQYHTNEEIELSQRAMRPHVVDVAPMRDREVLFVAERVQAARPHQHSAGTPHSRPIRLLGHIGLYLCCVCVIINAPMAVHNRRSSSKVNRKVQSRPKTTPAALSTSTTPTVPTTAPAATTT